MERGGVLLDLGFQSFPEAFCTGHGRLTEGESLQFSRLRKPLDQFPIS
jgi:hypothetical protein